jgi:hypothetical protein
VVHPQWCVTVRDGSSEDGAAPAARGAPLGRGGAREPAYTEDSAVRCEKTD